MNYVVASYGNYKEEKYLSINSIKRMEFVTITRVSC